MATHTTREAFRIAYQYARTLRQQRTFTSAYTLADAAVDCATENGFDYEPFLDVFNAVLWAMHWRFFKPCRDDVPQGMSERHLGFVADENGTTTFYSRRPLPV